MCIGFLTKFIKGMLDDGKDPVSIGKPAVEKELMKACKKAKDKDERFVSPLTHVLSAKGCN